MINKAILDTSPLICLYQLNLLEYLNLFYNSVMIPREVEREFLYNIPDIEEQNRRYVFLEEFYYKHEIWFIRCNLYSEDLINLYKTQDGIDAGEAEVFAQNQHLGSDHILLIDEINGRKLANKNNNAVSGVLYIIATLDIRFKICDYFKSTNILRNQFGFRISDRIINEVYQKVRKETNNITT